MDNLRIHVYSIWAQYRFIIYEIWLVYNLKLPKRIINEKIIIKFMTCDRCENQAAYTRKYSGEKLCSQCFSKSIVKKTAKTISKYKMIKHDELVAVAVSGGKDSLALLKVIHQMSINT